MRVIENYENIQAFSGEFAKPSPGGYILKVVSVEDVTLNPQTGKGDYLRINYDIAIGDFEGYYTAQNERFGGKWHANVIKSYKENALGMFKHFINCVEESNPGFKWDWQEQKLVGLRFGAILQEEEYEKQDGSIGSALKVVQIKSVADIKAGDYKVPPKKAMSRSAANNTRELISDDDLPW